VLVELDTVVTVANARRSRALARVVSALRDPGSTGAGLGVPVPGAASVLVPFDPLATDADAVAALIAPLLTADGPPDAAQPGAEHVLRVRYGGDAGPDLDAVAAETGLAPDDVIALHAGRQYEVLFIGFAPGFAYLGELPERLVVPRLATPRVRVPAGSVAIAGAMTAAYPHASAGGWRLLGRTDARLFDPAADPPARLRPGDRVRFEPA
jgi:KipI family sensor histidine kinase inhibitor